MDCNLVWNHISDFKMKWVHSTSLIWNHMYDFRPKLHNRKFNHYFITSILKSQTSVAQVQDFFGLYKCFVDPVISWFVETWLVSLNKQLVVVLLISKAFSLAWKKKQFKAKMVQFVNKLHQWGPIRLQGTAMIPKWM